MYEKYGQKLREYFLLKKFSKIFIFGPKKKNGESFDA